MDDQERQRYNHLINAVGWFFFDLFILGYVEDPLTGHSFRCPGGMEWAIYVEVHTYVHACAWKAAISSQKATLRPLGLIKRAISSQVLLNV